MAIETIKTFSGTDYADKLYIYFDWSITIKRDTSNGAYWIYFGDVIAYASSQSIISGMLFGTNANASHVRILRNSGTTGTIYDQTVTFSSNVESYKGKYARRGSAPSAMYLTPAEVSGDYAYMIIYNGSPYKLVSGKATVDTVAISSASSFYLPKIVSITAPSTVTLNAVNAFTINYTPPSGAPSYSLGLNAQSGVFGANLDKSSNLYISSSSVLSTFANSISTLYWYPNVNDASSGDFPGNVGQYKISFSSYLVSNGDFEKYSLLTGELTGQIQYNASPPAAAVTALTVSASVSETGSYTGLYAHYGKYINPLSKLNLSAYGSSSFGYGTTVSSQVYLNGSSSSGSRTNYEPPVGQGSWSITSTDNHGATKSQTITWDTYAYAFPSIVSFNASRCNQDGTPNDSGAYCKITYQFRITSLGNQNTKQVILDAPDGTHTYTNLDYDHGSPYQYISTADIEHSYSLSLTITDDFESVTMTRNLSTAGVIMDFLYDGKGIGLGKVAEYTDTVEVNPEWTFKAEKMTFKGQDLQMILESLGYVFPT